MTRHDVAREMLELLLVLALAGVVVWCWGA